MDSQSLCSGERSGLMDKGGIRNRLLAKILETSAVRIILIGIGLGRLEEGLNFVRKVPLGLFACNLTLKVLCQF